MTFNIDLSSDIEEAMKDVDKFFHSQIPFTLATAMNNTIFDVRSEIVNNTWSRAFTVRNPRIASLNWRVDKIITGGGNAHSFRGFKGGEIDNMFVQLRQRSDLKGGMRDWVEGHTEGGNKTPRGSQIAIPMKGDMRSKNGRITAGNKPRNITNKKGHFLMGGKNVEKQYIGYRAKGSKSIEFKYTFKRRAKINKTFYFYRDANIIVDRNFNKHWGNAMSVVINRSRFNSG